jgi:phosphoglycolate phosphatase
VAAPALLLDLDRTLVDVQSFTDYPAALADVRDLVSEWPDVVVPDTDWSAATQACMAVLVALADDPRWPSVSAAIAAHERAAVPSSAPMPRLHEAVAAWSGAPVAVVTLLPEDVARRALSWHDVAVDVVVGRRADLRPKPHGDGVTTACAALGVDPGQAVMVGDATWDLAAALDAGAGFVGVPRRPDTFPPGTAIAPDLREAVRTVLGR